jgi:hypothetical protein
MSATTPAVRAFKITITMPDGSQGSHEGLYASALMAAVESEGNFPQASRIEVTPLHRARAAQMCAHRSFRAQRSDLVQASTQSEGARA